MNVKTRRRLTFTTIVLYNLSTGIGYAIIFPTIWNYVHKRFEGGATTLGVVISAYCISSFFANPLFGWWDDKTQNTQVVLLVAVAAEIFGSLMYFFGIANWFLILSRLVAGIGGGGGAAVFADITRTTPENQRTSVFSMVVASRQLGLLIGPALNLFLSKANFHIGSFSVDQYTSPGIFMACLWILVELAVIFLYNNLSSLKNEDDIDQFFQQYNRSDSVMPETECYSDVDVPVENTLTSSYPGYANTLNTPVACNNYGSVPNLTVDALCRFGNDSVVNTAEIKTIHCNKVRSDESLHKHCFPNNFKSNFEQSVNASDSMIESAERFIQSASESFTYGTTNNVPANDVQFRGTSSRHTSVGYNISGTPYDSLPSTSEGEKVSLLRNIHIGLFRDEVIVLLGLSFISAFAQTVLETVVTPLAQEYYNFTPMENSLIYLFSGIEVILVFLSIKFLSKKLSDRVLVLFGLLTLSIATILPMTYVPSSVPGDMKTFPYFIITIIIDLAGIAVIVVCSASLLSKLVSDETQALSQGLRRSMSCLGCILGPLWGGAFLSYLYLLFAIPLAVTVLITILLLCSYKKLI